MKKFLMGIAILYSSVAFPMIFNDHGGFATEGVRPEDKSTFFDAEGTCFIKKECRDKEIFDRDVIKQEYDKTTGEVTLIQLSEKKKREKKSIEQSLLKDGNLNINAWFESKKLRTKNGNFLQIPRREDLSSPEQIKQDKELYKDFSNLQKALDSSIKKDFDNYKSAVNYFNTLDSFTYYLYKIGQTIGISNQNIIDLTNHEKNLKTQIIEDALQKENNLYNNELDLLKYSLRSVITRELFLKVRSQVDSENHEQELEILKKQEIIIVNEMASMQKPKNRFSFTKSHFRKSEIQGLNLQSHFQTKDSFWGTEKE